MFFAIFRVKAASTGREAIEVNPRNTSRNCAVCGAKVPKELEGQSGAKIEVA